MTKRSRAREVALQLLFQRDHNSNVATDAVHRFIESRLRDRDSRPFGLNLYQGVVDHLEEIDRRLAEAAENWRLPRMATVDRNALRLGAYELLFTPELDYLPQVSPKIIARFRSANLIAQLNATITGYGIAVLPHFMATAHPELHPVLPDEISISRTFWLLMHADSKDLARIRAVADYIYETVEKERALFSGG